MSVAMLVFWGVGSGRGGDQQAARAWRRRGLAVMAAGSLAGCGDAADSPGPVAWWHDLQGGAIAEHRPPPPGADQPYPSLGTIPAKPALPDPTLSAALTNQLQGEHDRTQLVGAEEAPPSSVRPSSPKPPPVAPGPSATLAAAEPPAPSPPQTQPQPQPAASAHGEGQMISDGRPDLPAIPDNPPPPPSFAPVAALPAPSPVRTPVLVAGAGIRVLFASGSAELAPTQNAVLGTAAIRRGADDATVTGYGESASADPADQANALALGLKRARAVADRLTARGVPADAIHLAAQAFGRDATIQFTQRPR